MISLVTDTATHLDQASRMAVLYLTVLVGGANGAIILASVAIHGGHDGYNFADGLADISLSQGDGL